MKVLYREDKFRKKKSSNIKDFLSNWQIIPDNLSLKDSQTYIVYAIEFNEEGHERFCVLESGIIFPSSFPSDLFDIVDTRISKFWDSVDDYKKLEKPKVFPRVISFKEWRENEYFHGEMVENIGEANYIFSQYQQVMNLEFKDPEYPTAFKIEDNLFLCCNCNFAIESIDNFEKVKCQQCNTIQNK